MTSNLLCLSTGLSSTELASWVQAIGSIVAIIAAVGVVIWQTSRQYTNGLELEQERTDSATRDTGRTLLELSQRAHEMATFLSVQLKTRELIYKAANGTIYVEMNQLIYLERVVTEIPVHTLPQKYVIYVITMALLLTQMRTKIEQVLRVHNTMKASDFTDYFDGIKMIVDRLAENYDSLTVAIL